MSKATKTPSTRSTSMSPPPVPMFPSEALPSVAVVEIDDQVEQRFLAYPFTWKKYKTSGLSWGEVIKRDPRYFKWVMSVMDQSTRTYDVLNKFVVS